MKYRMRLPEPSPASDRSFFERYVLLIGYLCLGGALLIVFYDFFTSPFNGGRIFAPPQYAGILYLWPTVITAIAISLFVRRSARSAFITCIIIDVVFEITLRILMKSGAMIVFNYVAPLDGIAVVYQFVSIFVFGILGRLISELWWRWKILLLVLPFILLPLTTYEIGMGAREPSLPMCRFLQWRYPRIGNQTVPCFTKIAVRTEDVSLCLPGYDGGGGCYDVIWNKMRQEGKTVDQTACARATPGEAQDTCNWELAVFLRDPSVCQKIQVRHGQVESCLGSVREGKYLWQ